MKEVFVQRLTLRPTLACNFHCKLCNEFSPYYHPPKVPKLEDLIRDVDRVFELVDRIDRMEVSGGEPLLYRPLPQLLDYLNRYNSRFELFSMVTNGSLLFSEETLNALSAIGRKVRVIVDDYGPELSVAAQQNVELLERAGVRYELRDQYENIHSDGWLDFRDLTLKRDEDEAKKLFAQCVCPQKLHWVITLHDGRLYPCHVARRCSELGTGPAVFPDCIDLYAPDLTNEQLKEQIMGLYDVDSLAACRYCEGFVETRERKIPAEQMR